MPAKFRVTYHEEWPRKAACKFCKKRVFDSDKSWQSNTKRGFKLIGRNKRASMLKKSVLAVRSHI